MTTLIPLMGNYHAGKTTTTSLLYFQKLIQGKKVATLQFEKGSYDIERYQDNKIPHYTIPLEAAKGKDVLERWLPTGYDVLILEGSYLRKPEWVIPWVFNHIFQDNEINEIIPFNEWDGELEGDYQRVITKAPPALRTLEIPSVDKQFNIHHEALLASVEVTPRCNLSRMSEDRKVIATGPIPYEWSGIFPHINYYPKVSAFTKQFRKGTYDYAIIGPVNKELRINPESQDLTRHKGKVICYDPYILDPTKTMYWDCTLDPDAGLTQRVIHTIKNEQVGTPFPEPDKDAERYCYLQYSNPLWTFGIYRDTPIVSHHPANEKIIECNGCVLPQYLIQKEYVEVL